MLDLYRLPRLHLLPSLFGLVPCLLAVALSGCAVGPNFVKPAPAAPDDWTTWRSGDDNLKLPVTAGEAMRADWWRSFGDPILDGLEQRAFESSPDLRTAALHFAQARAQRTTVVAQRVPEVGVSGGVTRQRQSEHGGSTRLLDAVGGASNRDDLAKQLAEPFNVYQAGFNASWEPDLWGRVARSVEAAGSDVARQAALLDLARLSLASEVARNYFELRTMQNQIRLAHDDIAALEDRLGLFVGADAILTHRADRKMTQGGALRF